MGKQVICKRCCHCGGISYNLGGKIFIDCLHDSGGMFYHPIYDCDDFRMIEYDTSCWDSDGHFIPDKLLEIRDDVVLGSLCLDDHENRFGIDPLKLSHFFEDYESFLEMENEEDTAARLMMFYESSDWLIDKDWLIKDPTKE